jgi:hypothetical protein
MANIRYWKVQAFTPEQSAYFSACARARNVSVSALMKRIVDAITKDDLVLSILDDNNCEAKRPGERSYRHGN